MAYILVLSDWLQKSPWQAQRETEPIEVWWGILQRPQLSAAQTGPALSTTALGDLGQNGQNTGQKAIQKLWQPHRPSNKHVRSRRQEQAVASLPTVVPFPGSASCLGHKLWDEKVIDSWVEGMEERPSLESLLPWVLQAGEGCLLAWLCWPLSRDRPGGWVAEPAGAGTGTQAHLLWLSPLRNKVFVAKSLVLPTLSYGLLGRYGTDRLIYRSNLICGKIVELGLEGFTDVLRIHLEVFSSFSTSSSSFIVRRRNWRPDRLRGLLKAPPLVPASEAHIPDPWQVASLGHTFLH